MASRQKNEILSLLIISFILMLMLFAWQRSTMKNGPEQTEELGQQNQN